jgi:hypothetical protein
LSLLIVLGGPENCIVPLNEEFALRRHLSTDPEFHEMALLKTLRRGKDQCSPSMLLDAFKVAQNKNLSLIEGRTVPYKTSSIIRESRHYSLARVGMLHT